MIVEYDTLPIKTFYKILCDPKKYVHLLGSSDNEKAWEEIIQTWKDKNPQPDEVKLVRSLKKVLIEMANLNQKILLMNLLLDYTGENIEDVFKSAKVKYIEDYKERIDYLLLQISKHKSKVEIFTAQFEKLQEEIKETKKSKEKTKSSVEDINKAIASFELHGFSIDNYEELTCGKFDAISKIIKDKK